jgi:peptide/nickel transport system substrate-binding protein
MTRSRRGAAWVAVILGAMAMALLAGCGQSGSSSGNADVAVYAYITSPVISWDPSIESTDGIVTLNNIYETLIRYDPAKDDFTPVLATSYSHSADGLKWTFSLRQGVKFHDGTPFNSQAVKFSIDRTMKLGKGLAYIWDPVKRIMTPNDSTVVFVLKYPAPVDLIAASSSGSWIMSPTAVTANGKDWFSSGHEAGTGPYTLQSQTMGQEVVLAKFPDYWGGWEGKHFSKVVIQQITEAATKRQLIEKGDADITIDLPSEDLQALKANPELNVMVGPSFTNVQYLLNTQRPPLDNANVRQALSYAFPYEDVVRYAMGGNALQARGAVPKGLWGYSESLPQYTFDMEKAKALLQKAGHPKGGFKLELLYISGDEAMRRGAELYRAQLSKLGIEMTLRGMPFETMWEVAKSKDSSKRQDVFVLDWWPDVVSPQSYLTGMFVTQDPPFFNLSYYSNPQFDRLVDKAGRMSGVDRTKAAQLYVDAQKILLDDAPAVFAYDKKYVGVARTSFKGFVDNPAYNRVVFFYDCYRE